MNKFQNGCHVDRIIRNIILIAGFYGETISRQLRFEWKLKSELLCNNNGIFKGRWFP